MANSNASAQHVVESSSTHDANHPTDPSSPNAFINEVPELSSFQDFISSPELAEKDVAEGDVSALLKQLEMADGVAQGVESKLDKLLENLEGLLEGLEASKVMSHLSLLRSIRS